jgi:hypothetical protein
MAWIGNQLARGKTLTVESDKGFVIVLAGHSVEGVGGGKQKILREQYIRVSIGIGRCTIEWIRRIALQCSKTRLFRLESQACIAKTKAAVQNLQIWSTGGNLPEVE